MLSKYDKCAQYGPLALKIDKKMNECKSQVQVPIPSMVPYLDELKKFDVEELDFEELTQLAETHRLALELAKANGFPHLAIQELSHKTWHYESRYKKFIPDYEKILCL